MKKVLLLILIIGLFTITACSKDTKQNEQGASETQTENNNEKATDSSTTGQDEEDTKATETAATEDESTEVADEENADTNEKDYLTDNYEFVASELTNLSEQQISDKWGEPSRSEEIQYRYSGTTQFVPAVVRYYQNEKYAVTFVEGKAARLVYSVIDEEILFTDDEKLRALELAGLPTDVEETTDTDTAFVYNDLGNVYEVTMFSKGEFVDYLYIILDEAYK
ncbi:hypothetical protein P8610_00095 [Fictibacillus sp. UD]|uniref:hypothetical protein n=1 Tax=Fictibacillus sp. UD TaxID=3038777 RepID=UPI0037461ED3